MFGLDNIVQLDQDHPGFRDPTYRQRRDAIARIALAHRSGDRVPDAPYTEQEHAVWAHIKSHLAPLHDRLVCRELNAIGAALALPTTRIPQLAEVNATLRRGVGFRMEPVAGLVKARLFLEHLGQGVFLSTQYIRHHSKPMYTPEPDVVHELVGHAASLLHPRICALSRLFGQRAAEATDEAEIERLTRLYWYTLEFGVCEEGGALKAVGAGLLSSIGELQRSTTGQTPTAPWDLAQIEATPYDPTTYQPVVFVAPSFDAMIDDLTAWLEA